MADSTMTADLAAELREERERYAEKAARVAFGLDFVFVQIGEMTQAEWNRRHVTVAEARRAEFLRNRPDADRYVLADYKRGFK